MSCPEVTELMQRYLDHDLSEMEQQTMVTHFGRCPECAAMFERLQQVSEGLEALPDVRPPRSIVDSILPLLNEIQPEKADRPMPMPVSGGKTAGSRKDRRRFVSRLVYGGTAAAVLVLCVFLFQSMNHGTSSVAKNASMDASEASAAGQDSHAVTQDQMKQNMADSAVTPAQTPNLAPAAQAGKAEALPQLATPGKMEEFTSSNQYGTMKTEDKAKMDKSTASSGKSAVQPEHDLRTDLTSSIASTPKTSGTASSGSREPAADLAPGTKQPENPSAGSGAFVQPAEISNDDSLGGTAKSSLANNSKGLLLGANVDLSSLASPGNKYLAAVENQHVVIRNSAGSVVFESPVQWEDGDAVQLTQWANSYQLLYVVKRSNGDLYEYMIDLALQQELKK